MELKSLYQFIIIKAIKNANSEIYILQENPVLLLTNQHLQTVNKNKYIDQEQ